MVKVAAGTETNVKIATDVKNAITTSTATTTDSGNIPDFKIHFNENFDMFVINMELLGTLGQSILRY